MKPVSNNLHNEDIVNPYRFHKTNVLKKNYENKYYMKNKIIFSQYKVSLIFVVLALTFQTLSCNQYSKKYKTASQKVNQLMDETIILPQNNKVLFKDSIYKNSLLRMKILK